MFKKLVIIGISILLIIPFQSVMGKNQIFSAKNNTQTSIQSFDSDIITMINQVDEQKIRDFLEEFESFGPKKTGSDNCIITAEYLFSKFKEFGLYTFFDNWRYPRYKIRDKVLLRDRNVVAFHNGTDPSSDAVIIVCAHYDTVGGSPGANDDGSGISTMLSIAEIVSKYYFSHTIRFVAFSGEEQGCFGSFHDAKQSYERDENIIAVLNIDGVGFVNNTGDGKIVQIRSPERSKWIIDFANDISEKFDSYIHLRAQYTLQSICDHKCYNDYGYDGVHFVQPKMELYHWMHTPEDTIDKINFTYLTKVTKLVLAITVELANKPIDVQIRIITPYEGKIYLFNLPILRTPGFNLIFTKMRGLTYLIGKSIVKVNITTDDEISSVYFGIDGYRNYACNELPYEWKIGRDVFPLPYRLKGYHRLTVCVITNSGNTAHDEMDIFVLQLF